MSIFSNNSAQNNALTISIIRVPHIRRLSLRVEPGGNILVRAPKRISDTAIARFVEEQKNWIKKQKIRMDNLKPLGQEELKILKKLAKIYLPVRVSELAKQHNFHYTSVTCRHQQTRWGSCSHKNSINLNIELMRLPPKLQDYIILHELTHTVHKHHQKAFWDHLDRVLPGSLVLDREMREWKIGHESHIPTQGEVPVS